jgi:hypothetical protein
MQRDLVVRAQGGDLDAFSALTAGRTSRLYAVARLIGHDRLTDVDTGRDAGTYSYECFLVDPASILYHCPCVTITLTDRGQIVFTDLIEHEPGRPPAVAPITGGTGDFLGATGTVTAKVLSGAGDFVITISK